jgi:hypothetical protein
MSKTFAKGLFYFVMVVLFLWTASLTYSFVSNVLPGAAWYVPLFSLVAFDVGMIAWMVVFIDYAEGSGQRATALALCVIDFIGVALMTLSEIFLGGQSIVAAPENLGEYALWGIGVWTAVNVGGVVAFHLLDPTARKKMAFQTEKDAIFDEAFSQLRTKRVQHSARLAGELSDGMFAELQAELAVDKDKDGVPDVYQGNGTARPATQAQPINGGYKNGAVRHESAGEPLPAVQPLTPANEPIRLSDVANGQNGIGPNG